MADYCPHLEYREAGDGTSFDHERPFCSVTESFVQPMRADVCNARYDLDPAEHCEFYREHEGLGSVTGFEADGADADATDGGAEDDE